MSDGEALAPMPCRSCRAEVRKVFLDLGTMPLANSYPAPEDPPEAEERHPLRARLCECCMLVQLDHAVLPQEIFEDYAYFSSYSDTWVAHAQRFAVDAIEAWGLGPNSLVVEVASNDGYLLQHFRARGVPVLGIEPARNVAEVARRRGVETHVRFFGTETARELASNGRRADLLVGNNVLAHVPDLHDFVAGLAMLVSDRGAVSLEFPHLLRLIEGVQFDTMYHEHFSYLSLWTVELALRAVGMRVFDVVELPTHGGSLRVLAERGRGERPEGEGLRAVRAAESTAGLMEAEAYDGFAPRVEACRRSLQRFFADARQDGLQVIGYGAAAKGNTLLNYCEVTSDDMTCVVDRSPHKQGRLLPGTRIPIRAPEVIRETKPDRLLILPWNLEEEVTAQTAYVREWGGRFVVAVPEVRVLS